MRRWILWGVTGPTDHYNIERQLGNCVRCSHFPNRAVFRRSSSLKTTKYGSFLQAFEKSKEKWLKFEEIGKYLPVLSFFCTVCTFSLNFSFLFQFFWDFFLNFLFAKQNPLFTFDKSIFIFNSFFHPNHQVSIVQHIFLYFLGIFPNVFRPFSSKKFRFKKKI